MAEVVPKVVAGKEVGGWSEALGLFHPNAAEARDRSWGPPRALLILEF